MSKTATYLLRVLIREEEEEEETSLSLTRIHIIPRQTRHFRLPEAFYVRLFGYARNQRNGKNIYYFGADKLTEP